VLGRRGGEGGARREGRLLCASDQLLLTSIPKGASGGREKNFWFGVLDGVIKASEISDFFMRWNGKLETERNGNSWGWTGCSVSSGKRTQGEIGKKGPPKKNLFIVGNYILNRELATGRDVVGERHRVADFNYVRGRNSTKQGRQGLPAPVFCRAKEGGLAEKRGKEKGKKGPK